MRPPYANSCRSKRESFENVRAAPDAAVHNDGDFPGNAFDHFGQAFDRGTKCFFSAPAMIRDHQTVHAVLHRELRIFARDDALDQQLDGYSIAQPFHEIPIHVRRLHGGDLRKIQAIKHRLPGCVCGEASGARSGPSTRKARVSALMTSGAFPFVHKLRTK